MSYLSIVPTEVNHRTILHCSDAGVAYPDREGCSWASTPLACLSAATEYLYGTVILYLTKPSSLEADPLIELCSLLKHNRHTRHAAVLAVCTARNRRTVESLKTAGADFVVFRNDLPAFWKDGGPVSPLNQLKEENRPEQVLSRLCRHLHYSPTPQGNELITCGACSDWLVLGPRRLGELCETSRHPDCPHFQHPRFPK
ncbi:MAG: hypothetical protein AB1427_01100 [Thermodesulfobacteriota bacterium]